MTFVMSVVAVVLLLAGTAALAAAAGVMRATQQLIRRRVDVLLTPTIASNADKDALGRADGVIRTVLGAGVARSWDSRISTRTLLIASLCPGVLIWGGLCVALRAPIWIWAPATVLGLLVPPQLLLRLEQARLGAKFVGLLPDTIDMMVRMLRAGLPMSAAIGVVASESASPMKEVFAAIADRMAIGVSFDQALIVAGKQIRLQDFRFFVVAASLQQSTGGNLASALETLSEIVRKRRAARMKARAVTAEVRMSAYVLAAMPFVVIVGLLVFSPAYLMPLITDRRGNVIIAIAAAELLVGFFVMNRMMRSVTRA